MHLSQNWLRHTERQAVATIKHFSEFSLSSKNRLRFFCLVEWITVKTKWKMPNILIKDDFLSLLVATPGLIFISTEKCKLYFFKSSFISSTLIFTYLVKEIKEPSWEINFEANFRSSINPLCSLPLTTPQATREGKVHITSKISGSRYDLKLECVTAMPFDKWVSDFRNLITWLLCVLQDRN